MSEPAKHPKWVVVEIEVGRLTAKCDRLKIRALDFADGPSVQAMLERCRDYYETLYGAPPTPAEAQSLYTSLPPNRTYRDKFLFGAFTVSQSPVAVLDLIRDHPSPTDWFLGFVAVDPPWRNKGVARAFITQVENWILTNGGKSLSATIAVQNSRALGLFKSLDFTVVGLPFDLELNHQRIPFLRLHRALAG